MSGIVIPPTLFFFLKIAASIWGIYEWIKNYGRMEYYTAERKGLLPFATAWMDLESSMLSEISQAVKDK